MILVASLFLTLGVVDLIRWSPDSASPRRLTLGLITGGATAVSLAAIIGTDLRGALMVIAAGIGSAVIWVVADSAPRIKRGGTTALAAIVLLQIGVLVAIPYAPPVEGPLGQWYSSLALTALKDVPVVQAITALGGSLFLLSTGNRIVRLILSVAGTPPVSGEANLKGGRLLGPLERTFILWLALAGDLSAAAIVIAAKGVLRLPEIRTAKQEKKGGADTITEYFLVGTFSSWLLAVGVAGLVFLSGG